MSDTTVEAEQEWPEDCELCGTKLETAFVDLADGAGREGETSTASETIAQDFCPNPDCPGKSSDEATAPGSLGGDNGGG